MGVFYSTETIEDMEVVAEIRRRKLLRCALKIRKNIFSKNSTSNDVLRYYRYIRAIVLHSGNSRKSLTEKQQAQVMREIKVAEV